MLSHLSFLLCAELFHQDNFCPCFQSFATRDLIARSYTMAPRKAPKAVVESSGQGSDIVSDTLPRSINTIKTWTHISNVLQPEVINCLDDSCDEENDDMSTKYKIVSQEEMHKIAARALDHVDLWTRTIFNE